VAYGIERRLKRELFSYLLADQDHYESLGRRSVSQSSYGGLIESLLPAEWTVLRDGMWIRCIPSDDAVPDQGFKIHLSTVSRHAQEVLSAAVPICLKARTAFKVLADDFILDHVNSKNGLRTSAGKFVTIYPQDRQSCLELLERLSEATQPFRGPYILSDRPYRDSRAVYYRYGSFRGILKLNLFGEKESMIRGRDGELVPDPRAPFFRLPAGVSDLLPAPTSGRGEGIVLRGRYSISNSLRFSNSGGIYRAEDLETRRAVVLKEARPLVNLSRRNTVDAVETLRKECRILQRMQHTPYVPEFVDFFQEWEHCFLVEEYLDGVPLSSFRAFSEIGLLLRRPFTAEHVREFCQTFARLARNLLAAVRTFHDNGILLGDLSPANILVDRETLAVKLIDFEGAFLIEEAGQAGDTTATVGFISPRRLQGRPLELADDYYALGSTLYSVILPVQEIFPANPAAQGRFLDLIVRDFDLPPEVSEVIFSLHSGEVERASAALDSMIAAIGSRDIQLRLGAEAGITPAEVERVITGVKDHLLASADLSREDRLWPADYRIFTTNPLNLGYGALGTALFLREVLGELPENIRAWIAGRSIDTDRYPPGLFAGLSGVAWALDELGEAERALHAMDLAFSSPLLYEGTDIFYGKAGVGLASLYFWSRTRQERFLVQARSMAASLMATAATDPDGLYWLNADDGHYYGFAHGGAGIAFFLLKLHQATGDPQYLEQGKAALEYEIRRAVEEPDGSITWPRSAADAWISPYWRFGASGVGSVLIRYAAAVGDERYRILAEKAARYVAVRFTVFPGQFVGLSGVGEFLLDMYHFTQDSSYLRDAWRLAEGVLMFHVQRPQGILFPGDELVRFSTDYGTGSAGIGLFLLRLLRPGARRFYDFALAPDVPLATPDSARR